MNQVLVYYPLALGILVFLLMSAQFRKSGKKGPVYTIMPLVFLTLGVLATEFITKPKAEQSQIVRETLENIGQAIPLQAAIQDLNPELAARLEQDFRQQLEKSRDNDPAKAYGRAFYSALLVRIPTARLDALAYCFEVAAREYAADTGKNPDICLEPVTPINFYTRFQTLAKPEQTALAVALIALLESGQAEKGELKQTVAEIEEKAEPIMAGILGAMQESLPPEAVRTLENLSAPSDLTDTQKQHVCQFKNQMFQEILALPEEQKDTAIRFLMYKAFANHLNTYN